MPDKQRVAVVIMDLDNTLFDWVHMWNRSFGAMFEVIREKSGIPRETLEREFKAIHEKYGTSEYAFAIEELPSLIEKHKSGNLREIYADAIEAYRSAREASLSLYQGVWETLTALKAAGCLLVGYTESRAYYSEFRILKLGLDGLLDYLYSPPDHALPEAVTRNKAGRPEKSSLTLQRTVHRFLREGEIKPNPTVLSEIISDLGGFPSQVVYVGDSLMKDVLMAKKAAITDVFAKYGLAQQRPEYDLLRSVTHWPQAAVEKEKALTESEAAPSFVLERSMLELLDMFEFVPFQHPAPAQYEAVLECWTKTVEVQEHFNDLELRIRNYAITLIVAILGASAFALKEGLTVNLFGVPTRVAAILVFLGAFACGAFWAMDRHWYHRLLIGAVKHGLNIERKWAGILPEIALTDSIGNESPTTIFGYKIHSPRKISLFYLLITAVLVLIGIALQSGTAPSPGEGKAGMQVRGATATNLPVTATPLPTPNGSPQPSQLP